MKVEIDFQKKRKKKTYFKVDLFIYFSLTIYAGNVSILKMSHTEIIL